MIWPCFHGFGNGRSISEEIASQRPSRNELSKISRQGRLQSEKQGCRQCTDALAQGRIGAVTVSFAMRDCPGNRKDEGKIYRDLAQRILPCFHGTGSTGLSFPMKQSGSDAISGSAVKTQIQDKSQPAPRLGACRVPPKRNLK